MKNVKSRKWFSLFTALVLLIMTSCDLLNMDKQLTAEDAKMEIRAAGEDIMYTMSGMMETPAMSSLLFFSNLMDIEFDVMKSASDQDAIMGKRQDAFMRFFSQNPVGGQSMMLPGISRVMKVARALNAQKSSQNENYGVYNYNFVSETFDLINTNVNYLEYNFPANEQAYNSQQRNAKLRFSNLEIVVVEVYDEDWDEYDEQEVPTSMDAKLWVDNQVVMEMEYRATVSEQGLPLSVSISLDMDPYTMTMTHSGSNRDYTTKAKFKHNTTDLLAIDMRFRYTADQEEVEKAEGSVTVHPLQFKGNIKPYSIGMCENLACMNNNIDMEVFQTELDKKIGDLGFREYEGDIQPVIVYEDDSFEYLNWIFEDIFEE
jgi:hypothetical protein